MNSYYVHMESLAWRLLLIPADELVMELATGSETEVERLGADTNKPGQYPVS